jgi:hypothetical protein
MAEPFFFGKDAGCDVIDGKAKCTLNGASCTKNGEQGCTADFTYKATCSADKKSGDCQSFNTVDFLSKNDCRIGSNNVAASDETFDYRSRCFNGGKKSGFFWNNDSSCYKAECKNGGLFLTISGKSYQCVTNFQKISYKDTAFFTCPNIKDFCQQELAACKNDCYLNGRC